MDVLSPEQEHVAKIGRRKLRAGSFLVIGVLLVDALFCLYFLATLNLEEKKVGLHPNVLTFILLVSGVLLAYGSWLMWRGLYTEVRVYRQELKHVEKQISEVMEQELIKDKLKKE